MSRLGGPVVRRAAGPALVLVGLLLAACNISNPGARYYDMLLPESRTPHSAAPLLDGTVEVKRPRANGLYGERAIVYAAPDKPRRGQYSDAYWIESPDRLVQQRLMTAWRQRGLAAELVTPDMRQDTQWQIAARLERLHQVGPVTGPESMTADQEAAAENQAHLAVELVLLRQAGNTIFLRERYEVTVPAGRDLDSFARAAGEAVDRVAAAFVEQVAARLNGTS